MIGYGFTTNHTENISAIDPDILHSFADLVKIRRHIHSHPEVGPVQQNTVEYIKEQFDGMDSDYAPHVWSPHLICRPTYPVARLKFQRSV